MVRKKRKGLVKESLAHGDSTGAPAAADMLQIVAHVPLNALVPFVLELDGRKPNTDASVTNDLATWYAALSVAPSRFDQLKLLQLFRASVKKLSGAEQGYATFAEATWRLFFRLYGAFSDVVLPLQKNFALVLQDLTTISSTGNVETLDLEKIAREELRAVLDALFETTKSLKNNADELVKVISHLQMLMEFPYVLKTLIHDSDSGAPNSYLRRTVAFLADQLDVLVTPIGDYLTIHGGDQDATVNDDEDEDTGASGPTNAVLKASERCSFALKCIIVLGSLKETLLKQLSASPSVSFAEAAADFARLLNHCTLILKTRVVHKDLLTQTGLAYSLLVRLLLNGSAPESPIVELLFRAVYPSVSEVGVGMGAELKDHVINDMKAFGEFARLAVFRGFINSLSDDELVKSVGTVLSSNQDRSILDYVFTTVHEYCAEESLNVRLYAFQVLEAFLRRAVGVISKSHVKTVEPIAKSTITNLTAVVLLNWESPSKRVNQFMHLMFTHIVNFQVLSGSFDAWKGGVVAKLIQLPQHSRARYGGLSILVTRYGAVSLLEEHPELLQSILYAVGIKDVSAAAAALFTQVLDELNQSGKKASEEELLKWRSYWVSDVVSVLLSKDAKLRSSVAMYALPLLLKKDPECVPGLITKLRASSQDGSKDVKLWAIIEVLKFARKKISPEKLLGLSMEEIQLGLENSRPEARGSAFEALCASLKSTNLPTPDEVRLIQRYLVISAKEITASTRMNSLNSLKTVFFRVKEFLRINTKESTDTRVTDEQKKQQAQEVARAKAFQQWLEHFVVTSVYPGSLVQRSIVGLEVLLLYLQVFGLPSTSESLLMTPHMVTSLLNMLIGSWDVIRALANTILDLYPAELPGFTTDAEMGMLWKWAMTLCISPRQRESDAGAHFMQLLYRRSESVAAHNVAELPSILPSGINIKDSRVRMILKLTDIISGRLAAADISRRESPLVHGLLLSLRYIIDGTDFFTLGDVSDEWKVALGRVFECVQQSMKLSLAVVGDATSGVGDESLSETFEGVVGEVSAAGGKTSAIPLRVDCRGHLILEDAEGNAEANDDADTEQRAVVGSWLAARECGAILDTIMRRVPLPSADNVESNFFPAELARQGGEMLLNSLFELKHKGAVATAYESFEGICKSFLAHGEKNPMIGSLPSAWADKLLDRLERSEQQFILRRSSGFAYSFVAILRAEPRNTAAIILPRVMTNLLRLASQDTDAMTAAAAPHQQAHLVWRSRVHALNILKLISQDAVLSNDVAVYVSQMIEYAIFGFECRSWVVRNSSMMLFAAATQRALGDKRIADGASKNKIPSAEVFSRFPQLDGFLYRALERFTDETRAENGVAPPGLFPVLMFLSRLRPTDEDEDDVLRARGSKPLADFVPLVMKCASQSVLPIRHMAAQVLGTIVRVDKAIPVLRLLSEELPEGVRAPTCASTGKPKSANYVHGVLLQAQSLIEKCLTTSSVDADDALAFIVSEFLPKHFWLSSGRVKASSIRAVVWEIIEAVFRGHVERTSRFTFGDLFEGVSNAVLVAVDGCLSQQSVDNSNRVPGEYKLNRAVVGTFFCLVKLNWKSTSKETAFTDTWLSRIEALLQCPVLEVRKRAFKQLDGFLHSSSFEFSKETPILVRLRAVLLKQLLVESHPTVKARLLQLLIEIQDSVVTKLEPANVDAIQTFLNLLATSANVDVIGPSLRLLAASVRDGAKSDSVLKALKDNVVSRSSESQPLGVRFAAAVAIERSQLLVAHAKQASGTIEIAVDAWLTVIKLLQDDDSHVRDVARAAVYESLRELENGFALDESVSETALLPFAIGYIVKTFSSTSYGYEAISGMLLATVDAPTLLAEYTSGSKAKDWGDLCNRIFEAEGNNFYAEADLLAQLLATCVFSQSVDMVTLKTQVLEKLVESLKMLNDSHTREQWLGGMTYYASVFPTFYSLLCVGVAAVESLREGECAQLVSSLREQAAIAQPHLTGGHPLVVKALVALQQTSSKVLSELVFLSPEWAAIH